MKTIKYKEDIKLMVDKLDPSELRIVKQLIDSLTSNKKPSPIRRKSTKKYYTEVIELLEGNLLTTGDIDQGREERI
jgi:hypothetical protein